MPDWTSTMLQLDTNPTPDYRPHAPSDSDHGLIWTPIDSEREIRLLTFDSAEPAYEDFDAKYRFYERSIHEGIACRLNVARRDEVRDRYVALSYTWGRDNDASALYRSDDHRGEDPKYCITVNDISVPVTRNCYNALGILRSIHVGEPMWIDALCIDQNNVDERNSQVRLMDHVFQNAKSTLVYLDEDPFFRQVHAPSAPLPELWSRPAGLEDPRKDRWETYSPFGHQGRTGSRLHPELFYRSPWFTRTWVVQETVLSKQLCFIFELCEDAVPWNQVQQAYDIWMNSNGLDEMPEILRMKQAFAQRGLSRFSVRQELESLTIEQKSSSKRRPVGLFKRTFARWDRHHQAATSDK